MSLEITTQNPITLNPQQSIEFASLALRNGLADVDTSADPTTWQVDFGAMTQMHINASVKNETTQVSPGLFMSPEDREEYDRLKELLAADAAEEAETPLQAESTPLLTAGAAAPLPVVANKPPPTTEPVFSGYGAPKGDETRFKAPFQKSQRPAAAQEAPLAENEPIVLQTAFESRIGGRPRQEDSVAVDGQFQSGVDDQELNQILGRLGFPSLMNAEKAIAQLINEGKIKGVSVVCDGIGGLGNGDMASAVTIKSVYGFISQEINSSRSSGKNMQEIMSGAVYKAAQLVDKIQGGGDTNILIAMTDRMGMTHTFSIGNAMAFHRQAKGETTLVSNDKILNTLVKEGPQVCKERFDLVDKEGNPVPPLEKPSDLFNHVIAGKSDCLKIHLQQSEQQWNQSMQNSYAMVKLEPGDELILCTDDVWEAVGREYQPILDEIDNKYSEAIRRSKDAEERLLHFRSAWGEIFNRVHMLNPPEESTPNEILRTLMKNVYFDPTSNFPDNQTAVVIKAVDQQEKKIQGGNVYIDTKELKDIPKPSPTKLLKIGSGETPESVYESNLAVLMRQILNQAPERGNIFVNDPHVWIISGDELTKKSPFHSHEMWLEYTDTNGRIQFIDDYTSATRIMPKSKDVRLCVSAELAQKMVPGIQIEDFSALVRSISKLLPLNSENALKGKKFSLGAPLPVIEPATPTPVPIRSFVPPPQPPAQVETVPLPMNWTLQLLPDQPMLNQIGGILDQIADGYRVNTILQEDTVPQFLPLIIEQILVDGVAGEYIDMVRNLQIPQFSFPRVGEIKFIATGNADFKGGASGFGLDKSTKIECSMKMVDGKPTITKMQVSVADIGAWNNTKLIVAGGKIKSEAQKRDLDGDLTNACIKRGLQVSVAKFTIGDKNVQLSTIKAAQKNEHKYVSPP